MSLSWRGWTVPNGLRSSAAMPAIWPSETFQPGRSVRSVVPISFKTALIIEESDSRAAASNCHSFLKTNSAAVQWPRQKTVNLNVLWYFRSHFSFSLTSARSLIILSAVSKWNTPVITAQKLPTTEGNPRHSHCQTVCQPPFLSRFNGSHCRERHY